MSRTPGPWHVDDGNSECYGIFDDDGEPICYASGDPMGGEGLRGVETDYANALLIAAAPDLLAACQKAMVALVVFSHTRQWDQDRYEDTIGDLVDAIAKAKGGQS